MIEGLGKVAFAAVLAIINWATASAEKKRELVRNVVDQAGKLEPALAIEEAAIAGNNATIDKKLDKLEGKTKPPVELKPPRLEDDAPPVTVDARRFDLTDDVDTDGGPSEK